MKRTLSLLAALLLAPLATLHSAEISRPNIIGILVDDMGHTDARLDGCTAATK